MISQQENAAEIDIYLTQKIIITNEGLQFIYVHGI